MSKITLNGVDYAGGGGSGGHTIINPSGQNMPSRTGLQFIGASVTDDSVNNKTVVTITGGGGGVHYSTSEQVIGTWIDGKPLYEKTFELTQQLDLTQNTWVKSELDQGTMKGLFYVLFTNDLGACLNNIAGGFIDNKIAFNSPRALGFAPAENVKVTLQYTKTTD